MNERIIELFSRMDGEVINEYDWNDYELAYEVKVYTKRKGYCGYFLIDPEDFDRVSQHSWKIQNNYVYTNINGNQVRLGRFILNATENDSVRYSNRCGLDNRRCNFITNLLKIVDRGIVLINGLYNASISVNYELINLGNYTNLRDAISVRNRAEYYNGLRDDLKCPLIYY